MRFLIFLSFAFFLSSFSAAFADPVMDRINKTQTIRCGYVTFHPAIYKDAKTNNLMGYAHEIFEEVAERLYLNIEWVYETNWPVIATDLKSDKFDVACVTYWSNPRSARHMLSSDPFLYQPVFFIKRSDDTRFEENLSDINKPDIRISTLEGDVPETIIRQLYPKSTQVALPQFSSFSQVFQEVASGRADVTIASKEDVADFNKFNDNVLKVIDTKPVRVFPMVALMLPEATQVKNAFDTTILEMHLDGTIEEIVKKYVADKDGYYVPKHNYKDVYLKSEE